MEGIFLTKNKIMLEMLQDMSQQVFAQSNDKSQGARVIPTTEIRDRIPA